MEDGLKLGLVIGGVIAIVMFQQKPKQKDNGRQVTMNVIYTPEIVEPEPGIPPPPNVDGCVIPAEAAGRKFKLIDSSTCEWEVVSASTSTDNFSDSSAVSGTARGPYNPYDPYGGGDVSVQSEAILGGLAYL